jgi:hypothetical protein
MVLSYATHVRDMARELPIRLQTDTKSVVIQVSLLRAELRRLLD